MANTLQELLTEKKKFQNLVSEKAQNEGKHRKEISALKISLKTIRVDKEKSEQSLKVEVEELNVKWAIVTTANEVENEALKENCKGEIQRVKKQAEIEIIDARQRANDAMAKVSDLKSSSNKELPPPQSAEKEISEKIALINDKLLGPPVGKSVASMQMQKMRLGGLIRNKLHRTVSRAWLQWVKFSLVTHNEKLKSEILRKNTRSSVAPHTNANASPPTATTFSTPTKPTPIEKFKDRQRASLLRSSEIINERKREDNFQFHKTMRSSEKSSFKFKQTRTKPTPTPLVGSEEEEEEENIGDFVDDSMPPEEVYESAENFVRLLEIQNREQEQEQQQRLRESQMRESQQKITPHRRKPPKPPPTPSRIIISANDYLNSPII